MSNIERISETVASKISINLSLQDEDKEEVLAYGAFVLLQTILSIVMIAVFGFIFHVLFEVMIISFAASILRKSSGGAHASTPMNCAVISVIIFGGLALAVKHYIITLNVIYVIVGMIGAFIFSFFILYKFSPVETASKPLRNENKRKCLKKQSIHMTFIYFIINLLFIGFYIPTKQEYLLSAAISVSVGTVWQSITLVSLGHKIINGIDIVLVGTNRCIRRRKHNEQKSN